MELFKHRDLTYNASQFSLDLFEEDSGTIDADFGYSKRKPFMKANITNRKPINKVLLFSKLYSKSCNQP